jgi:DNA polymerase sigma
MHRLPYRLTLVSYSICRFYISLDVRVRHVILFLKHWAHLHKLTGPNSITSYALTWLVIFYLQDASGFGLPSVELQQRRHEGPTKRIAGECSVCDWFVVIAEVSPA